MAVHVIIVCAVKRQTYAFGTRGDRTAVPVLAEAQIAAAGIKDPADTSGLLQDHGQAKLIPVKPGGFFNILNRQKYNAAADCHKIPPPTVFSETIIPQALPADGIHRSPRVGRPPRARFRSLYQKNRQKVKKSGRSFAIINEKNGQKDPGAVPDVRVRNKKEKRRESD